MNLKIQSAIAAVDKLLAAKQTPTSRRRPVKASGATKPAARKLTTGKVTSSAKKHKILAMLGVGSKPNLRLLNKLVNRGVITAEEVVNAVGEALFLKRVNKRIVEAITNALRETLMDAGEMVEMDESEAA